MKRETLSLDVDSQLAHDFELNSIKLHFVVVTIITKSHNKSKLHTYYFSFTLFGYKHNAF